MVLAELLLTDHEKTMFTLDGSSLRRYLMQADGKLPTSLRSAGSQADACPCGCRQAFSEHLIKQRGVYAQIVQVQVGDAVGFRHLHPCELAILNAMPPPPAWMFGDIPNLRLCLGAIGQLASPLQSAWVGACVMPVDPAEVLHNFKSTLFSCARDLFPNVPAAPPVAWTVLTYPDGTSTRVQVHPDTTAIELFQAEFAMTKEPPADHWVDAATGSTLDFYTLVAGKHIVVQCATGHAVTSVSSASPSGAGPSISVPVDQPVLGDSDLTATAMDFPLDSSDEAAEQPEVEPIPDLVGAESHSSGGGDHATVAVADNPGGSMDALFGLRNLTGAQLSALVPPLVPDERSCKMFRQVTVHIPSHLEVLENQGSAIGDDELALHLSSCVCAFLVGLMSSFWIRCLHLAGFSVALSMRSLLGFSSIPP